MPRLIYKVAKFYGVYKDVYIKMSNKKKKKMVFLKSLNIQLPLFTAAFTDT